MQRLSVSEALEARSEAALSPREWDASGPSACGSLAR